METITLVAVMIACAVLYLVAAYYLDGTVDIRQDTVFVFDMDGTLCEWEEGKDTHKNGFFLSRTANKRMVELIQKMHKRGFKVAILSSVYVDDHSAKEKRAWLIKEGLDFVEPFFVPYGTDKSIAKWDICEKYHAYNLILVDDYSKNLFSWLETGGRAVKMLNGVNGTKGTWAAHGGPTISKDMSVSQMLHVLVNV